VSEAAPGKDKFLSSASADELLAESFVNVAIRKPVNAVVKARG
jgi:hypothetical protein